MGWGLLGRIGSGISHGIDRAAYNALGGGLLGSALQPDQQQQAPPQGGLLGVVGDGATDENPMQQAQAPAPPQRWQPDPQQQRQLSSQYLMGIGSALSRAGSGQPLDIGGALQDYQRNAVGQIQAGQQAQQQNLQRQNLAQFQQAMQTAGTDPQARQQVLLRAVSIFGPEGAKQLAEAYHAMTPVQPKIHGSETRIDPVSGKAVSVNLFDDGSERISPFGVERKTKDIDLGGIIRTVDERTGETIREVPKTMTPGEVATSKKPGDAWQFFVNSYAKKLGTTPENLDHKQVEAGLAQFKQANADPELRASMLASRNLADATRQMMLSNQPTQEQADTVANDLIHHNIAPEQMSQLLGRDSNGNMRRMIYTAAKKIDPNFDFTQASSEYQLAKSPGFQNTVRFMDSATNSIPRLQETANAVANSKVRAFSQLKNAVGGQFNNLDLKKFQTDRLLVGDEISKILAGGGSGSVTSDAKLAAGVGIIKESDDPQAVAAALGEVKTLLGYRRESLTRGTYMAKPSQQPQQNQQPAPGGGGGGVKTWNPKTMRFE